MHDPPTGGMATAAEVLWIRWIGNWNPHSCQGLESFSSPQYLQMHASGSRPIVEVTEHDLLPGPCLESALGHR